MKGFLFALFACLILAGTVGAQCDCPKGKCQCNALEQYCPGCIMAVSAPVSIYEETAPKLDENALVPCVDGTWHKLSEYGQQDKSRKLAEEYVRSHPTTQPVHDNWSRFQQGGYGLGNVDYGNMPATGGCAGGSCSGSGSRSGFFGRRR